MGHRTTSYNRRMLLLLACAAPPSDSRAFSPLGTYDGSLTVSADTPVDFCARWDRITGDLDALNGNQRVDDRLTRIESPRSVNVRRSAP